MVVAWVAAGYLAYRHAGVTRDYTAMLDGAALRNLQPPTPMQHIVPTNYADAQTWVRYALTFEEKDTPSRVRYTYNDNAPQGREVHWNSGFAHLVNWGGHLRRAFTDEPMPLATERMLPWFNLPVLMVFVLGLSAWAGHRAGAAAGVLVALGIVGYDSFYAGFSPHYVDHHGFLTATTFGVVLGAIFMGAGWWQKESESQGHLLPISLAQARHAAIFSALCGALGIWFSAASTIPPIALTGIAGLVATWVFGRSARRDGAHFDASLWRLWGRTGAGAAVVFYLLEYAPFNLGFRMEVNNPLYALAWLGGSEIVALLCEYRMAEKPTWPAAWKLLWPVLAIAAAPLTILLGGMKVFVVSDPFIAEIPKTVVEGMSLAAIVKVFGGNTLYQYLNWNMAPFLITGALLFVPKQREKHLLLFAMVVGLGFLAMMLKQVRWAFGASGPYLALMLVSLAALLNTRKGAIRWVAVLAVCGFCFVPGAMNRINVLANAVKMRTPDKMDVQQLIYRDVALVIRNSQPKGDITVLASPNGSCGIGYYGNFKTLGTLYWENYAGMRAAAEIFSATSYEKARELILAHGVTHVAMISEESFLQQFFDILNPTAGKDAIKDTFGYKLLVNQALPTWLRPIPYNIPVDARLPNLRVLLLQVVPPQSDRDANWHIALAQLGMGDGENAVKTFEGAIMMSPENERVPLCQTAANICYSNGAHVAAVRLYRDALTAGPNPLIQANLAWVLATSRVDQVRNAREALEIIQKLDQTDPTVLSVAAAANADLGNFGAASNLAAQALEANRTKGAPAQEPQFAARLEAFKNGRVWRQ